MRPVVMVVADVLGHEALEMPLIEHDDMIEQVSAAVADEALGDAVLPGTAEVRSLWLDPKALDGTDDFCVEVRAAVEDQILRCFFIWKSLSQLLRNPGTRRMPGDVAVQDAPAVMGDYEEARDHAERQSRDSEEIHRGDHFAMVAQKCSLSLR